MGLACSLRRGLGCINGSRAAIAPKCDMLLLSRTEAASAGLAGGAVEQNLRTGCINDALPVGLSHSRSGPANRCGSGMRVEAVGFWDPSCTATVGVVRGTNDVNHQA